ncbi:hypothetical protein ACFWY6_35095 [Streptomyces sp. NPDC059037]|uniref:hypothetical protein n=1 Tax=Streptomyces sp. NPDC059037 TaxID=3346710 RepID=UPI0036BDA121
MPHEQGTHHHGAPAFAADKEPSSLMEIAEQISHYAKCDDLGLVEKADCLREFTRKALIAGAGTALFLYGTQSVMKDNGARFKTLNTELDALGKLKLAELKDKGFAQMDGSLKTMNTGVTEVNQGWPRPTRA